MTTKPQHEQWDEIVEVARLRDEAAKVPGLEARNEEAKAAHLLLDRAGIAPVVANISERVRLLLESYDRVASERDALRETETELRHELAGAYEVGGSAESRVKELEAQVAGARNAALEEAANLLDNVDSANPASLIRALASQPPPAPAQATAPTCGARLHLLNDEPVSPCHLAPGHTEERHEGWVLGSKCTWTGGPATYEGEDAQPAPAPSVRDVRVGEPGWVDRILRVPELTPTTQPAPAQEDRRVPDHTCIMCGAATYSMGTTRSAAPTPPALVEAVGSIADRLRAVALLDEDYGEGETSGYALWWGGPDDGYDGVASVAQVRALLAAYDAAKGGHGPDRYCPKCGHVAHWSGHSYCTARNGLAGPCGCKHTPPSGGGK